MVTKPNEFDEKVQAQFRKRAMRKARKVHCLSEAKAIAQLADADPQDPGETDMRLAELYVQIAQADALVAIAEKTETQPELLIDASLLWAARSALRWLQNLEEAGHVKILIACQPEGVGMQYLARHVDKYKAL